MGSEVYVVLFRGVGGATKLPTAPLREALTTAGFERVATYIASGNVVLKSNASAEDVERRVAGVARDLCGFEKDIMVVPAAAWAEMIARNPFPEAVGVPTTLHAFALKREPDKADADSLAKRAAPSERVVVRGNFLYFHAPKGFGVSKLPPIIDRILKTPSTARNWNSVLRLRELAEEA